MKTIRATFLVPVLLVMASVAVRAEEVVDWPPLTAVEQSRETEDWAFGAPAVILRRHGRLLLSPVSGAPSRMIMHTRLKILDERGVSLGTVRLATSTLSQIRSLVGRTVLPDGRTVELSSDAVFTALDSTVAGRGTVSFVLPEVGVGSIIEYRYERALESLYFPEPWFFASRLPVLSSRFTVDVPPIYEFDVRVMCPGSDEIIQSENVGEESRSTVLNAERVHAVVEEPLGPPVADLGCRVFPVTIAVTDLHRRPVLESWESVIEHLQGHRRSGYRSVRWDSGATRRQGRRLAKSVVGDRKKAAVIFRWLRDHVATIPQSAIVVRPLRSDDLLKRREATPAEKAVMLQLMLEGGGLSSSLAWIRSREKGELFPDVPSPHQFDTMITVARIDGEAVYLDPSNRRNAFGVLPATLEGVPCLLIDSNPPSWSKTPETSAGVSRQDAHVELEIGPTGVINGRGQLILTGHQAWFRLNPGREPERQRAVWSRWLERRMPGTRVTGIAVTEEVEAQRLEILWSSVSREETVLGDEAFVAVSQPLTLDRNPLTLQSSERRTSVSRGFAESQESVIIVTWPEAWMVDFIPDLPTIENRVGRTSYAIAVDAGARGMTIRRSVVINQRDFDLQVYDDLRNLFRVMAIADAEDVILAVE